jgi:hypothetical protein
LPHRGPHLGHRLSILDRIKRDKFILVWILNDFLDLGVRSAIGKALQRLALAGDIRRIDRYDPATRLVDVANGDANLATLIDPERHRNRFGKVIRRADYRRTMERPEFSDIDRRRSCCGDTNTDTVSTLLDGTVRADRVLLRQKHFV